MTDIEKHLTQFLKNPKGSMTPTPLEGEKISIGNQIVQVKSYLKDQDYIDRNGQAIIEQQKIGSICLFLIWAVKYIRSK